MRRVIAFAFLGSLSAAAFGEVVDGGAQVSVQVDKNGDTTLDVARGNVDVKSGGGNARVGAGESVRAQNGKPLRKLLAAPMLRAPGDGSLIKRGDVTLAWDKVPGAARYTVEIAGAPDFSTVKQSQSSIVNSATITLPSGTWHWRVVALGADDTRGKISLARKITVDVTPPKLKAGKPEWR